MTSLTRVQSSLELLCQTAGALEAGNVDKDSSLSGQASSLMPRVSPTTLGGASRTAETHSPFGGASFTAGSRVNSNHYLVGASPSHDSFTGFDEDDSVAAAVPNRPWILNEGHVVSVREGHGDSLRRDGHPGNEHTMPLGFAPNGRSSSFQPPTWTGAGYPLIAREAPIPIYRPIAGGGETAPINNRNHSLLSMTPSSGSQSTDPNYVPTVQELFSENAHLRSELFAKDRHIQSLVATVEDLQGQIASLKSLPVGKISQIPVE